MIPLGFEVSEELRPKLLAWAELCEDLWSTWNEFSAQFSGGPTAGSPFRADVDAFEVAHPAADRLIASAAGHLGSRLVAAMGQHICALAVLLRSGVITLSVYAIVRAELELAGTATWLLDPGIRDGAVPTDRRVARGLMFALSDTRDHLKAEPYATSNLVEKLRESETKILEQINSVFGEVTLSGVSTRSWQLGAERYPSRNSTLDRFSTLAFVSSPSLYGFFSRFSHPSIVTLELLSMKTYTSSTVRIDYHIPSDVIEDCVKLAIISFYKIAYVVAWYFGFDTDTLAEWEKSAPDGWFNQVRVL